MSATRKSQKTDKKNKDVEMETSKKSKGLEHNRAVIKPEIVENVSQNPL
jgi:hypothetical protein